MENMARKALPDAIYNWIIDCTKFDGSILELMDILANIVQDSSVGPASFIVTAHWQCASQGC